LDRPAGRPVRHRGQGVIDGLCCGGRSYHSNEGVVSQISARFLPCFPGQADPVPAWALWSLPGRGRQPWASVPVGLAGRAVGAGRSGVALSLPGTRQVLDPVVMRSERRLNNAW